MLPPPCPPQLPDRKQKGRVVGGSENPEYRLLDAVRQAMQLNGAAADAVAKEVKGLTGGCAAALRRHPPRLN